jgi:hypothetical protein
VDFEAVLLVGGLGAHSDFVGVWEEDSFMEPRDGMERSR